MWILREIKFVFDLVIFYSLKYFLVENVWCLEMLWIILLFFLFDLGGWFLWVVNKVYIWKDEIMKFINMVIRVFIINFFK